MSRLVPYRTKVPENIKARIEETLSRTMYLVQTTGPTSYVIQEQGCEKKFKVFIGALQSCSCGDGDVCVHILYVILKIFRVPTSVPIVWQKSLIDSEIEMLLRGDYRERTESATTVGQRQPMAFLRRREAQQQQQQKEQEQKNQTEQLIERHELVNGEVCAICQEDMDDKQPLTYCRKGCGNNFHIECMRVFGESRKQSKENIICPLCRHDWGDSALTEIKKELEKVNRAPNVHKGASCKKCQAKPIRNERYRCLQCKNVDLCDRCFKSNAHQKHSFVMKNNVTDPWIPALRGQRRSVLSSETIADLENRDLSTNDYDILLQLDQGEKYPIQEYLLTVLPGQKISAQQAKTYGEPGAMCSLCRQSLRIQTDIRTVLCGHTFHESCLSRSILAQQYTCPYQGCEHVMFPGLNELYLKQKKKEEKQQQQQQQQEGTQGTVSFSSANRASGGGLPPLDSTFCVMAIRRSREGSCVEIIPNTTVNTVPKDDAKSKPALRPNAIGPRRLRAESNQVPHAEDLSLGISTLGLTSNGRASREESDSVFSSTTIETHKNAVRPRLHPGTKRPAGVLRRMSRPTDNQNDISSLLPTLVTFSSQPQPLSSSSSNRVTSAPSLSITEDKSPTAQPNVALPKLGRTRSFNSDRSMAKSLFPEDLGLSMGPQIDRMSLAAKAREESKNADKERLRKQRLQREERIKQAHSGNNANNNNNSNQELSLGVSPHDTNRLDDRLAKAQEYRNAQQNRNKQEREKKRRFREDRPQILAQALDPTQELGGFSLLAGQRRGYDSIEL